MKIVLENREPHADYEIWRVKSVTGALIEYQNDGTTVVSPFNKTEIKESEMRPMTRDEMVIKACSPWGYAVRIEGGQWQSPAWVRYISDGYEWCDTTSGTFGEPRKFEVEA